MRGKAVLVLPLAVLLTHGFSVRAGDEGDGIEVPDPNALPEITTEDLRNIADRLKDFAASNVVENVFSSVEGSDEVDAGFVQRALGSLSELVSRSDASGLLENLEEATGGTVRDILKAEGDEADPVETIVNYFLSLKRVLSSNDYLRNQVTELLQRNARELLSSNSIVEVLKDIMESPTFMDLEEEIREDMQTKGGYVISGPEENDDMSR